MAGEWGLLRNWPHSWPGAPRQDKHLHNHQGRALKYPVENYWRVERLVYPGTSSILFYLPGSLAAWVGPAFLLKHDSRVSMCQGWSSGIKRQKFDFSGLQTLNCDHSHLCPVWHPERSPAWGLAGEPERPCGINMSLNSKTAPGDFRMGCRNFIGTKSALTNAHWMVNYNRNSVNVWESHMNIKQIHYHQCYYSEYQMSS